MITKARNKILDTNYTWVIKQWWFPVVERTEVKKVDNRGRIDRFVDFFVQRRKDYRRTID